MSHRQLWAPWRLSYVTSTDPKPSVHSDCFLCRYREQPNADAEQFVVTRSETAFVVLNRFPYNNGHLLIAPLAHSADLRDLDDRQMLDCGRLLQQMLDALTKVMKPDGFNVGLNLGRVAGAGLPGHLHWHIVPRWSGDTNFMSVIGETKVIPQSLAALYQLLTDELCREPSGAAVAPSL